MESAVLVRHLMTSDVKTVGANDTLREIIQKMVKFHIGSVVVVQEQRPIGIITERDVLIRLAQATANLDLVKAKDLMSGPVLTISENQTVEEASKFMTQNHIKKLVVTRGERLVGIVTSTDIMRSASRLTDDARTRALEWIWRRPEEP